MIAQIDPKTMKARYFDIRKLTPKECGRLMGVNDEELNSMINEAWTLADGKETRLTNSALYKLFGNSIVVDVLAAIYRRLWYADHDDATDPNAPLPLFEEEPWSLQVPDTLRIVTLCSGYDAQCLAMKRLSAWAAQEPDAKPLQFDLVAWSEFDPESKTPLERQPAVVAHNLLFPQWAERNVGDMTKANWQEVMQKYNELSETTPPLRKSTYSHILLHVPTSRRQANEQASLLAVAHAQQFFGTQRKLSKPCVQRYCCKKMLPHSSISRI